MDMVRHDYKRIYLDPFVFYKEPHALNYYILVIIIYQKGLPAENGSCEKAYEIHDIK